MVETEPRPISHSEGELPVMLVIVSLVDGLSLLKAEVDINEELVSLHHVLDDCRDPGLAGLVRADRWGVTTINHPERSVTERCLVGGVVDVLHPRKPSQPLSGSIACEAV